MTARLRAGTILLFWLPLAATWLMMAVEGPYVAAIVARMPAAAHSLAAYGVAVALAWLIESPIMMLLSAATALVHGRASYLALRRFAFLLNGAVTVGMIILSLPPVFRFIGETLIGLPPEISRLAHAATAIMIPWPAAIGYRRFYQGILVRHHLTRRVAYGTVVRLATMSVMGALLAWRGDVPGAVLGAMAMLTGVVAEAVASRWMAAGIVRELMERDEPESGSLLTMRAITSFYAPLALTSMLAMALGPLVTFGLGRGRMPIESLAVWPVIQSTAFIFRSGGFAFQEVGIALTGRAGEHAPEIRRTALLLGLLSSIALAALAFTPLHAVWLRDVSGLSERLASFSVLPIQILVLLPLLEYLLAVQRTRWIVSHRTGVITISTAMECVGLALALFVAVGPLSMPGAVGGAIALLVGRLSANAFLLLQSKPMRSARVALLVLLLSLTGCASAPGGSLRVLVYNIHAGKDAARVDNLERVAALIESTRADLVLLQEVDRGTTRSGNVDQVATLERLTGMHGAFGRSLDYQGGHYGIAILSRWRIEAAETAPLHVDPPQARAGGSVEPRVALIADVTTPRGAITVVNTHFDHTADDIWRRQEVARLLAVLGDRARRPLLVGGDFNATPDSAIITSLRDAGLVDAWTLCGGGDALTYPAGVPVKRIDYLFLTGDARCTSARVIDTNASDHRPVLIEVVR